jgi:hypothetical protein
MKKLLNISVIAALAILPAAANAATGEIVSVTGPATAASKSQADNAVTATAAPKYALAVEAATDATNVATASYVKGAYNEAMKAINKVSETAGSAVQSVTAGTANGTISVDNGADITVYDDSTLVDRVDDIEDSIGDTTLTTTEQTLTGAIEEVKAVADTAIQSVTTGDSTSGNGTIKVDGQAVSVYGLGSAAFVNTGDLADTANTYSNTTSGLTATTIQDAIDEVEGRVDTAESKIGNTPLTTTSQTLTGAIEEVKSNALTSSSLTDYAKKTGVTQTITNSTIAGTVPTVTVWGQETTGTAAITASITGATYAEPAAQGGGN